MLKKKEKQAKRKGQGGGGLGYSNTTYTGYISHTLFSGSGITPGNASDSDRGTAGNGTTVNKTFGQDGLVVIYWQ